MNGELISNPRDVCARFRVYYTQLYQFRTNKSTEEISSFLDKFPLPSLPQDVGVDLVLPIIEDKIQRVISQMATRKSPGPDGFPVDWYNRNIEFHSARFSNNSLQLSHCSRVIAALDNEKAFDSLYADDMLVYLADP